MGVARLLDSNFLVDNTYSIWKFAKTPNIFVNHCMFKTRGYTYLSDFLSFLLENKGGSSHNTNFGAKRK